MDNITKRIYEEGGDLYVFDWESFKIAASKNRDALMNALCRDQNEAIKNEKLLSDETMRNHLRYRDKKGATYPNNIETIKYYGEILKKDPYAFLTRYRPYGSSTFQESIHQEIMTNINTAITKDDKVDFVAEIRKEAEIRIKVAMQYMLPKDRSIIMKCFRVFCDMTIAVADAAEMDSALLDRYFKIRNETVDRMFEIVWRLALNFIWFTTSINVEYFAIYLAQYWLEDNRRLLYFDPDYTDYSPWDFYLKKAYFDTLEKSNIEIAYALKCELLIALQNMFIRELGRGETVDFYNRGRALKIY